MNHGNILKNRRSPDSQQKVQYEDKWAIVLGLTSNLGAADFELQKIETEIEDLHEGIHTKKTQTSYLYEAVLKKLVHGEQKKI